MAPSATLGTNLAAASVPTKTLNGPSALTREDLEKKITNTRLVSLWSAPVSVEEPSTKHIPAVWNYSDTQELLCAAGQLVPASESERRALIMVNPGPNKPPYTTDTLLGAHQLLLPGEKALCHRHTPFAVRFLIEGSKGYTAISGKKMYMAPGDLIITPQYFWHDHGNDGTDNVIWFDGLNIPFFKSIPVDFLEQYEDVYGTVTHESFPVNDSACEEMKFPWTKTKALLDADAAEKDHSIHLYKLPDGNEVNQIASAAAERIAAGASTLPRQDTTNRIFQVHSGSGTVKAVSSKGEEFELTWGARDAFVVPSWFKFTIAANSAEPVYLFVMSDRSFQDKLGLYRAKC